MKTKLHFIGIASFVILLCSCGTGNMPKKFDYGQVENHKYYNSFFALELEVPHDWVVQTKEQTKELTEKGKNLAAGDDQNMKALIDASEINTANLLAVFQYEVGTPVAYNPSFALVAENLKNSPGIQSASDYLFHVRKHLKQSQIKVDYLDEACKQELINGQEFCVMNLSMHFMEIEIKQIYYATMQHGFCLSAVISFVDDEQKDELETIIQSMEFEK